MARTILRDDQRLAHLAEELKTLVAAIDNEENVPERYESTLAAELASADAELLSQSLKVVHRLQRWSMFETTVIERYTRLLPQVTG